jgi:16S rRNA (uracil1498-N3)-methyltransferase
MPRFYCPAPLQTGLALSLPAGAARHVQVLRMQPGDSITLFNGEGGEFEATVTRMGRSDVEVEVGAHQPTEREAPCAVHLLAGITANERMDWLVEKATELGAASITPITAERSVLKLKGERADKKLAHWQGVAVAAAEQCGRNRVTRIDAASTVAQWVTQHPAADATGMRLVLSLSEGTRPLTEAVQGQTTVTLLSGPEQAIGAGFVPVTLGPRVLRAETAPLAVLAALTLR